MNEKLWDSPVLALIFTLNVSSPHGNGVAEVNDDGAWSVRVEFVTASYNEEFTVKVMDHKGSMKNFAFVSKFEG